MKYQLRGRNNVNMSPVWPSLHCFRKAVAARLFKRIVKAVVSFSFLLIANGVTASDRHPEMVTFLPGIIIDPLNNRIYMMNQNRGIDSITINAGERAWHSDQISKPLLLHNHILYAQRERPEHDNRLSIAALNVDDLGQPIFESKIELPSEIVVSVSDLATSSFSIHSDFCGNDLVLKWFYLSRPLSGIGINSDFQPASTMRTGIISINLTTGTVNSGAAATVCTQTPSVPPEISRVMETETWVEKPRLLDDTWAAVQSVTDAGRRRIVLRRWDAESAKILPTIELFGNDLTLRYASADGRYLLASRVAVQDRTMNTPYEWSIFSLRSGKRIAKLRHKDPAAWFLIHDSLLVHEVKSQSKLVEGMRVDEPRKLRAIDLQTGKVRWDYPVRDLGYYGTFPPLELSK